MGSLPLGRCCFWILSEDRAGKCVWTHTRTHTCISIYLYIVKNPEFTMNLPLPAEHYRVHSNLTPFSGSERPAPVSPYISFARFPVCSQSSALLPLGPRPGRLLRLRSLPCPSYFLCPLTTSLAPAPKPHWLWPLQRKSKERKQNDTCLKEKRRREGKKEELTGF